MKSLLAACLVIALGEAKSQANPLVIDDSQRSTVMTAEEVTVLVRPGISTVSGTFTFKEGPDQWPKVKDTHVLLFVPVFELRGAEKVPAPQVKVNGVAIPEQHRNDLTLADSPALISVNLPKNFYMVAHEYAVPLRVIGRTFSVSLTYEQRNFPGEVAAYLPIKPPATGGKIIFKAAEKHVLKPFSARRFWHPSFASLEFTPEDRQLLQVKCVKGK